MYSIYNVELLQKIDFVSYKYGTCNILSTTIRPFNIFVISTRINSQLERSGHDYITRFNPSDCTRRLICYAATGRKETIALKNVLEILPKDDEEIPQPLRKLANQLITAKNTASYVKVLSPAKLLLNVLYLDSNLNK